MRKGLGFVGNTEFIKNIRETGLESCEKAGSFLQSAAWGKFKSRFGWKSRAFLVDWTGFDAEQARLLAILTLFRHISPGFSFVYVPWGPESAHFKDGQKSPALTELAQKLRPFFPGNTVFIRFDPPWFVEEKNEAPDLFLPLKRAGADIQPPSTVLVDLSLPENEILANMKPKWRYNIGLAEKRGVNVSCTGADGLEVFYGLLKETAARDGIAIHSIDYYKTLFEIYGAENDARLSLYTAAFKGEAIAAIVVLCRGEQATYLYGASSNQNRNLMAAYALQWKAMQDAKAQGCLLYDLFGIPPNDDPGHPMAGLYRFKTGFGGRIVHRPGSWDYPYRPFFYSLFCAVELARKKIRDLKKKR